MRGLARFSFLVGDGLPFLEPRRIKKCRSSGPVREGNHRQAGGGQHVQKISQFPESGCLFSFVGIKSERVTPAIGDVLCSQGVQKRFQGSSELESPPGEVRQQRNQVAVEM